MQEALNLAKALKDNTHLTELYASGHDLSTAAIRAISDAVGESPSIQVVCLGNSTLGDDGTTALAEGIAHSRSLQQLDLECKAVGAAGAASLGKALQGGLSITTLLLARNPLGNSGERSTLYFEQTILDSIRPSTCLITSCCQQLKASSKIKRLKYLPREAMWGTKAKMIRLCQQFTFQYRSGRDLQRSAEQ